MSKERPTRVTFRVDKEGVVFALFPDIPGAPGLCTSYQHVGQHSSANLFGCIQSSKPATETQYADLKKELEDIGYVLDVKKRISR